MGFYNAEQTPQYKYFIGAHPIISLAAHVGWLVCIPQDKEHPAASLLPLALPGRGRKSWILSWSLEKSAENVKC